MEKDEAERVIREALAGREDVAEALEALLRQGPGRTRLEPDQIRTMTGDSIRQFTRERADVATRIDTMMAAGKMPSPRDFDMFAQTHQLLALWRAVHDGLDKGADPVQVLRTVRRSAFRMILDNSTLIGTSYARAHADATRRSAALFLSLTDSDADE